MDKTSLTYRRILTDFNVQNQNSNTCATHYLLVCVCVCECGISQNTNHQSTKEENRFDMLPMHTRNAHKLYDTILSNSIAMTDPLPFDLHLSIQKHRCNPHYRSAKQEITFNVEIWQLETTNSSNNKTDLIVNLSRNFQTKIKETILNTDLNTRTKLWLAATTIIINANENDSKSLVLNCSNESSTLN